MCIPGCNSLISRFTLKKKLQKKISSDCYITNSSSIYSVIKVQILTPFSPAVQEVKFLSLG